MDFNVWLSNLRSLVQEQGSPVQIRNGHWEIVDRKVLWDNVGGRIFDGHVEKLSAGCLDVLSETNPELDLAAEERSAAMLLGRTTRYSPDLRRGMSETLALLGSRGSVLVNCTRHKPENTAVNVVHELLSNAEWQLWGSLSELLPNVAEAAPGEFLNCVEAALLSQNTPLLRLFSEGGNGFSSRNYISGLLWALEALAWSKEHFMRVTLILAELASIDPGGSQDNRPVNTLKTLVLPWFPQTMANGDKRVASIKAVRAEFPQIAWDVLISLLPNQHQTSMGTYKPRWLEVVPEGWEPKTSQQEYWDQVEAYAEMAVEMSFHDLNRLKDLVKNLDNLPKDSFDRLLEYLSSDSVRGLIESDRSGIWSVLTEFVTKHRRFSDAEWSLDDDIVSRIEVVASALAPVSVEILYQRLFSRRDFDLYEEKGDWEVQRKKLEDKRNHAVSEILNQHGVDGVLRFIESVESPQLVGGALGAVSGYEVDERLLPDYLITDNNSFKIFIAAFVWSRNYSNKVGWVRGLDRSGWSREQVCELLKFLPFDTDTWGLVDEWLGENSGEYWETVTVNPYAAEGDLIIAVDRLLEVGRARDAVECLSARLHKQLPLDIGRTVSALLGAVREEFSGALDSYNVAELIKALQINQDTNSEDMCLVEWSYLPMLGAFGEAKPKFLQEKLATKPGFFCEIIQLVYRSVKEKDKDDSAGEVSEGSKSIATNAWRLLDEWKWPPGLDDDGGFHETVLIQWLAEVEKQCAESGHLEVAKVKFGEVLFYCPADPNGLWIVEAAAKVLNSRDGDSIRSGYCTEVFNSRGAHWVDPSGAQEKEIAAHWRDKANSIENAGFPRFAASLRELASSYDRQADRVIDRHGRMV